MLVPGFTVQELPVKLSNINNLRFTPDGKLTALGYDGRVHILRDTDGDGLEDQDTLFWDKPTLSVPVGMAWSKAGLYVSSHGKVSLLRDTNGDGKADVEEIIASGWVPTDVGSGGVDATAVTLDRAGNLYFGLLTADYSNPYRVKDGVSRYDLTGQRGTIQKWSVSTKQLETIATGIRVPYTLAFNRRGDLFVTDQEGETWCPGGNPLDELNHIIPGRNYGFPPRHEQYLPNLISEPPVVAFGPQHQSSCGLVFNESSKNQKRFGPPSWEGDAFVAGESRGKIWRVRLVKTPAGYVGKETILARLNMLTTDVAISPRGDLYVCCHSGLPDWGTGPQGQGKLFKISHTDPRAPQPVAAWPSGPMEVRLAFDKPIDGVVTNRPDEIKIEFGEYVSAADRFEVLKPPYKAVNQQDATPRGYLRVVSARLSPDARTLVLTTDPHPQSVRYALMLPEVKAAKSKGAAATVDLAYDLYGVEASWFERGDGTLASWSGWAPHLDWQVNEAFAVHSAEHDRLFDQVRRKGRLQLRTQLVGLGRNAKVRVEASAPFDVTIGAKPVKGQPARAESYAAEFALDPVGEPEPLSINLETGLAGTPALHASYSTDSDPTWRPLPFGSLLLPWAPPHQAPPPLPEEKTELAGGDFERGRALFFGERLKCGTCHRVRGDGGVIGPDLSNLVHRDAASVLRDIKDPNATINPDYVAYNVRLRDGGDITGFVRAQSGDSLRVVGADGKELQVRREEVTDMRPSAVSLMPAGLLDGLMEAQVRDLLTFLLHEPPARSRAQVEAVLRQDGNEEADSKRQPRPLTIVLAASKQDHGPGQHDYPAWQKKWMTLLGQLPGVSVVEAWEWPTDEQFRAADVMVFYFWNHNWSAERLRQLDDYQARGGGLVIFHSATIADKEPETLAERIGLASQSGPTKYLHSPFVLNFVAPASHPITRGFKQLNLLDEPYWPMIGDTNRIEILATAEMEGEPRPLLWTFQKGKGRVFASIPGHYSWTFDDPLFRVLALRGVAWAAGEPVRRFEKP
jgi:putative heme-binding domain-containing protein